MSTTVTIEGSQTPSVLLGRGERRTVQLTDRVQRLIDLGYVVVVQDGSAVPEPESAPLAEPPAEPTYDDPTGDVAVPSLSASTDTWRSFLDALDIPYEPELGREALIALYRSSTADDGG